MTKIYTLKRIAVLFFALYTSLALAHSPVISLSGNPAGSPTIIKGTHLNSRAFTILKVLHKKNIAFGYPVMLPSPTITSFSPSSGPVGTSVVISGANFNTTKTSNIVFFGATRATVVEATESSLTVTVPVGATYQPISVLNGSTQLTGYSASPFVTTFSPNNSNITQADFFSQQDFHPTSSSTAQFMTTGDLDGDGKADVVSINSDPVTNSISIFRNISNSGTITAASFADKVDLPIDDAPGGIVIGDLDGDGKPELIALDASGKVSVFRNTCTSGVISFAQKVDLNIILNAVSVSIGDLDNDGRADIVVSDRKDGKVFVFRNTSTIGNITFANAIAAVTFPKGGGGPENVAIGDLDGDGKADMTVANKVSGLVSVFPNISTIGNIVFGTELVLTPGSKPVKAALGDFNGDGKPDIAVANSASSTVSVFQNNSSVGTMSFATKVDLPADIKVTNLAIADIDGDGKVDIVSVAVNGGGMISVFRNKHTSGAISVSSFAAKSLLNGLLQDVTIGDIDGDGRPDLAGTNLKVVTILRYNPFKTKVSDAFSGKTLANIDSAIRADVVPSATTYRFRVSQGTNVQTFDAQTNSFKLTQLTNYAYNTSYSIDVQVEAGGSWSDYGTVGVVTTPAPLTQVSESLRGKTLISVDSDILVDPAPLATSYHFRVTQGTNVQTFDAQTNSFKLTQLTNYAYGTSYSIDVQVQVGGNWSNYGTAYTVTTPVPLTQVSNSFRGNTLVGIDSSIPADVVPLATTYRFRVSQGTNVQTFDAQTNSFKLTQLTNYAYSTSYSIDVLVQLNGSWGNYGTAYTITTPAVPVTQVSNSIRGNTLAGIDSSIPADVVPSATTYRFRVTQGTNVQTFDAQTNSFKLTQLTNYAYSTSYSIDVLVQLNGSWGNYGTAYTITTPAVPVTQVSNSFRGNVLASIDSSIRADVVPSATTYRFRVTQGTNVQTFDAQTNSFKLTQLINYAHNTSYSIDVQIQAGISWGEYGAAYVVTTPMPLTQVSNSIRGKTLTSIDSSIPADAVPSAITYRFRVTRDAKVQTIDVQTNSFKLTQLANYAYNADYSIDVQIQLGGSWSDYGTAYVVTTPAPLTQVSESFRGKTLANIDSEISADQLPLATGYHFRITKDASVQILDAQTNSFRLNQLTNYAYNTSYSIDVQVQAGGSWGNYGTAYVVTTPAPLTQVSESFRGKTLANTDSVITADPIPLATGYLFRVTKGSTAQTFDAQTNSFKMNQLANYAYNARYSMDVAVKTGPILGAFGAVTFINTPVVPVTQIAAVYNGATLTDLDGAVRADGLPLATDYRFRVKLGNRPAQIIEEKVAQTLLYKTSFYAYNTTYIVDVSAKIEDTWTDYGATCSVTTLAAPVTQISLIDCGKLLTTNDGQIHADNVPTATAYRFRITTNGQTEFLEEPTGFVRLAAMPSYEFNTTYSIQVSALVNDAWTTYGAACNVTTPVLVPQISTEMCGTVLKTAVGEIHEDLIPATLFMFKISDGVHTTVLESPVGSIRLSSVPFYAYNTVFSIQVAVVRNGVTTPYGPVCHVTTTDAVLTTKVASDYSGKVLTTNDGQIYADDLPLATKYRFRVTQGDNIDFLTQSTSFVRLAALSFFAFNTTYSIQVSALVNDVWTAYGETCNVTTSAPLTQVSASYCGTVLPGWNAQIQADLVDFANAYQFEVTQGANVQNVSSATNTLQLNDVPFFIYGTPFSVKVAAKEGNAVAAYGTACALTTLPAPPTITSFSPASGPIGTSVIITGANFNTTPASNIVFFGATMATVNAATATSLTVTVPAGASYQPISVLNGSTSLTGYSAIPFTTTFTPNKGSLAVPDMAAKVDFATGGTPVLVAMGDLDGDGKPDLAVTNAGSNTVSIYRNTSVSGTINTASFEAKVDFATGSTPIQVVIGDLDGDGKPDLAVTNSGSSTVSIYHNKSVSGTINTASFDAKVDLATVSSPRGLAIGDVDGDGKPELVVTNTVNTNWSISVFHNTSSSGPFTTASFDAKVDFAAGREPFCVAIGDIDGDGKPDLATANNSGTTVSVFRNTSVKGAITTGSFAAFVDFTVGNGPRGIAIGDLDGDGKLDLAVANGSGRSISILRNTATSGSINAASFATNVEFVVGNTSILPDWVVIGDIDGDGKPDVAWANFLNAICVLRNVSTSGSLTTASFAPKVDFPVGTPPFGVAIGDLDGDGKTDIVSTNTNASQISVLRNMPIYGATDEIFSNTTVTTTTASWTNGTGESRAVFMSAVSTGAPLPTDNTTYTGNAAFGSGTKEPNNWYCVYNGTGTSVNITGLAGGTTYRLMTVEYTGTTGSQKYLTTEGTNNPVNITTDPGPVISMQPSTVPQTLCINTDPTALTVTAAGAGLTYQWYRNTTNSTSGGTPVSTAIGQKYQGGIIAYILKPGDPGYDASSTKGLIVATEDYSTTAAFFPIRGINITGTLTALGSGSANTAAITATSGNTSATAASIAKAYVGGGFNDWYLPSKNELHLLYLNVGNGASGDNKNIAHFSTNNYWSSSQNDINNAYIEVLASGTITSLGKTNKYSVRAVRSFSIPNPGLVPPTNTAGTSYYYVVVSATNGISLTSDVSGAVTVNESIPSVNIAASPGTVIAANTSVTFTATPINGGSSPAYQWFKNNSAIGTNSATYTDEGLINGDVITCTLTSNADCITTATAASNSLTMAVSTISATNSISEVSSIYGEVSGNTSFDVGGSNLTTDLIIVAPTGYEVSTSTSSGFLNSMVLPQTDGTVATTTIYLRLAANVPVGPYAGNVILTSTGATEVDLATVSSTIGQKAIAVTATATSKNYGDTDPAFAYTTDVQLVSGDEFTGSLTRDAGENVGDHDITQGTLALNANYNLSYHSAKLTIGQKAIAVTATAASKNYGDTDPAFAYTTDVQLISGDEFTGSLTRDAGENVGDYAITQGTLSLNSNYNLTYNDANLTIGKKVIDVMANVQSKIYNNADPVLTYNFSPALITGDNFTGVLSRAPGENAGSYEINQGTLALSTNYTLNYTVANLTITNKTLTITADNQNKTYGQANPVLTVSYSGFVNGDSQSIITTQAVISTIATPNSNAGDYAITATDAVVPNYTVVYVPGTLTVNKALLTVTADNKIRNFGVASPALTVSYSGLVNGDSQSSLTTPAVAFTIATANSALGNYVITASGATSNNYTITYNNGILTVVPLTNANIASLMISSGILSPTFSSSTTDYTASVAYDVSSLILIPTYDPNATATINGTPVPNGAPSYDLPLNTGNNTITTIVTAQDGVTRVTYTLTVYRTTAPIAIRPTNILSPNGDGKNDVWVIKDIALYPNNAVTIYDKAGHTIYSKRGYNNDWDGTLKGAPLPQGTYYYIIEFGVGVSPVKGFITILKSH